jgi:hypothetical protein
VAESGESVMHIKSAEVIDFNQFKEKRATKMVMAMMEKEIAEGMDVATFLEKLRKARAMDGEVKT